MPQVQLDLPDLLVLPVLRDRPAQQVLQVQPEQLVLQDQLDQQVQQEPPEQKERQDQLVQLDLLVPQEQRV